MVSHSLWGTTPVVIPGLLFPRPHPPPRPTLILPGSKAQPDSLLASFLPSLSLLGHACNCFLTLSASANMLRGQPAKSVLETTKYCADRRSPASKLTQAGKTGQAARATQARILTHFHQNVSFLETRTNLGSCFLWENCRPS